MALAFLRPAIAEREEPAQSAVSRTVSRIADSFKAVGCDQSRADDKADASLLGCGVGADNAGQSIAIGNADGRKFQLGGLADDLMRV